MNKRSIVVLLVSHTLAIGVGFAVGIYALPILIAPPAPDLEAVEQAAEISEFFGEFSRDREDSDLFHWGEGEFSIGADTISFSGELAPGPDYRLYLSPEFVETEEAFHRLKPGMVQVAEIKTFENFMVPLSESVDAANYTTAIVWCEKFGQFITSGTYQPR